MKHLRALRRLRADKCVAVDVWSLVGDVVSVGMIQAHRELPVWQAQHCLGGWIGLRRHEDERLAGDVVASRGRTHVGRRALTNRVARADRSVASEVLFHVAIIVFLLPTVDASETDAGAVAAARGTIRFPIHERLARTANVRVQVGP